jgi:hypothetical protein
MGNGPTESIHFTRLDAERIATCEAQIKGLTKRIGRVVKFYYAVGTIVIGTCGSVIVKLFA